MGVVGQVLSRLTVGEALKLDRLEKVIEKGLETFWEVGQALGTIRDERLYRAKFETFEDYCRAEWDMSGRRGRQLSDAAGVMQNLLVAPATVMAEPGNLKSEGPKSEKGGNGTIVPKGMWIVKRASRPSEGLGDHFLNTHDGWTTMQEKAATFLSAQTAAARLAGRVGEIVPLQEVGMKPSSPRVLPASESVVRSLAGLDAAEQRKIWDEAVKGAPGGKGPTAKQVVELVERGKRAQKAQEDLAAERSRAACGEEGFPDIDWPKPNAHGVYSEVGSERIHFVCAGGEASINVLQIGPRCWIGGHSVLWEAQGFAIGTPLKLLGRGLTSRIDVVRDEVGTVKRLCQEWFRSSVIKSARPALVKLMAWTDKVSAGLDDARGERGGNGKSQMADGKGRGEDEARARWASKVSIEQVNQEIGWGRDHDEKLAQELVKSVGPDAQSLGCLRKRKSTLAAIEDRLRVIGFVPEARAGRAGR